ncbi:hypothetical protein BH10BAC4_BH10BAC4_16220 [soil metagenome]
MKIIRKSAAAGLTTKLSTIGDGVIDRTNKEL